MRPIQPGDHEWDMMQKFQPLVDKILSGQMDIASNAMFEHQRQMEQMAKTINNNSVINNIANNRNIQQPVVNHISVTLPNVTNSTSAEALMMDLQSLNRKKFQFDWNK